MYTTPNKQILIQYKYKGSWSDISESFTKLKQYREELEYLNEYGVYEGYRIIERITKIKEKVITENNPK